MTEVDQSRAEDTHASTANSKDVLEELLAQERVALDPYFGKSDPTQYVANYAEKMTYFDPWSSGKLEDEAAKEHLLASAGTVPPFTYEILDPSVDLFGNTAIFTFNIDVIDPAAGGTFAVWNTTEVHNRAGDGWELVHAHWSFAVPPKGAVEG